MKDSCSEFIKQINRIAGQVNGVSKMIETGRTTNEIVQQISAARAALSRLAVDILKDESQACFSQKTQADKTKKFEELVQNFFKIT